ncbi:MAG TPA: alpha/beta hydrolase [Euzebya sp.]|nr:alpha/beta hydrolase [Euzebya sp.]
MSPAPPGGAAAKRRRGRPEEQPVTVDGVRLNVAVGGQPGGPVLLLLHGLAARWQAFGPLLPAFRSTHRLIAPDLRGHGGSAHTGGYTVGAMTRDMIGVVEQLVPPSQRIVIYGHSLGGWVGLAMAVMMGDRVRAVIAGDTAIQPKEVDPEMAVNYMADAPLALRSLSKAQAQLDEEVMTTFRAGRLAADFHPVEVLSAVRCPVLLLQADDTEGALMKDSDVALAKQHLADVRHTHFNGVGHGLHIEAPSEVVEVVTAFLDGLPA